MGSQQNPLSEDPEVTSPCIGQAGGGISIFSVCTNPKHRVILMLIYSAGLRISEVINPKPSDIDPARMTVLIR